MIKHGLVWGPSHLIKASGPEARTCCAYSVVFPSVLLKGSQRFVYSSFLSLFLKFVNKTKFIFYYKKFGFYLYLAALVRFQFLYGCFLVSLELMC